MSEVIKDLKKEFTGSVRCSCDLLFTLIEAEHHQAAVQILPKVKGFMQEFEATLQRLIDQSPPPAQ